MEVIQQKVNKVQMWGSQLYYCCGENVEILSHPVHWTNLFCCLSTALNQRGFYNIIVGGVGSAVGKMATRFTTAGGSKSARKVGNKNENFQNVDV